jgi:hypothetical protein
MWRQLQRHVLAAGEAQDPARRTARVSARCVGQVLDTGVYLSRICGGVLPTGNGIFQDFLQRFEPG